MEKRDKAFIILFNEAFPDGIKRKTAAKSIDPVFYSKLVLNNLGQIDERYQLLTERFRDQVVIKAICAEFLLVNAGNESKLSLLFPRYDDVLGGINYFSNVNRIDPINISEESILIDFNYLKYSKKNG